LVLFIVVSIIGGAAIRFYRVESLQTAEDLVNYRLQQSARVGLESTYSFLNSMGTSTLTMTSPSSVESTASATNLSVNNCSYFPRTDDVILPVASSGNYADTTLSDSNTSCITARPSSSSLSPSQLDRYVLSSGTASSANTFNTSGLLSSIDSSNASTDKNFRSVFPWVRYRSQAGLMDAQYGSSESIQAQINQCGLSSGFTTATATGNTPVASYNYVQQMNGLGPALNLGSSNLDVGTNGLTLEAWVWVPNSTAATRSWQKIFDIGRGQADQDIVFGYSGTTGQIDLQLYSNCSSPGSSTSVANCSGQNTNSTLFSVPYNSILPTDSNQFNASSPNDVWYYIAAVVKPEDTVNHQTTYSIYTACQASQVATTQALTSSCSNGSVQTNSNFGTDSSQKLRLRDSATWTWTNNHTMVGAAYRQIYIGYSFWSDPYLQGMVKNIRVWNTALSTDQLGSPLNPSYTVDNKTSILISNTSQNQSLRISPLYSNGNDRLLLFTAQESGQTFSNTYRLVSCAWNTKVPKRVTRSVRFRVVGNNRPEVIEYLAY